MKSKKCYIVTTLLDDDEDRRYWDDDYQEWSNHQREATRFTLRMAWYTCHAADLKSCYTAGVVKIVKKKTRRDYVVKAVHHERGEPIYYGETCSHVELQRNARRFTRDEALVACGMYKALFGGISTGYGYRLTDVRVVKLTPKVKN